MALIPCPECGKEVSDRALACPACGFPVVAGLEEMKEVQKVREKERLHNEKIRKEMEQVSEISRHTDVLCCDLNGVRFDQKVLKLVPGDIAERYCAIPLSIDETDGALLIVTDDLNQDKMKEVLSVFTGKVIKLILGSRTAILDEIKKQYQNI